MIRSCPMLRDASVAAATAVLALTVGLSAAAPAMADDGDTPPGLCLLDCPTEGTQPEEPGKAIPGGPPTNTATPTTIPTRPAAEPVPTVPAVPVAPAPALVPTAAPEPTVSAVQETPTPEATTSTATPSATSASPSAESNWDKPVTRPAKPTQAAAVSRNDGSGLFGSPGLLAIMAGVLLVGLSGLAFAWWGKNRFSAD